MSIYITGGKHVLIADDDRIDFADEDFHLTTWLKVTTFDNGGDEPVVATKISGFAAQLESYLLRYWDNTGSANHRKVNWAVGNGSTGATVFASTHGALTAGVWYFVDAFHDATANLIGIAVNAGTSDTTAYSSGSSANALDLAFGQFPDRAGNFAEAEIADFRLYRRRLSDAERAIIYHARGADRIIDAMECRYRCDDAPDGTAVAALCDIGPHGLAASTVSSPVIRAAPFRTVAKPVIAI